MAHLLCLVFIRTHNVTYKDTLKNTREKTSAPGSLKRSLRTRAQKRLADASLLFAIITAWALSQYRHENQMVIRSQYHSTARKDNRYHSPDTLVFEVSFLRNTALICTMPCDRYRHAHKEEVKRNKKTHSNE